MPPNSRLYTGPTIPTVYDPAWQVYTNLTPDQQAWFRSQPQWLIFYAGLRRWQKEANGITVSGIPISTTTNDLALLSGLAIRATRDQQSNPSVTYAFTDNGAAVPMTIAKALALFDAVSGFIQLCRNAEATLIAGVNAKPPTVTTESQIDAAIAAVSTVF